MRQYEWSAWSDRIKSFTGKWALERWFLMYLHEQKNINALALELKNRLKGIGLSGQVRVQSIWVDGTPQAEFSPKDHSPRAQKPQCELADLLLCVRWETADGTLQGERAMLIQAKVASKHNKLPGGKSTKKERSLFEDCNRHNDITLYPGAGKVNPIGSYQLGSGAGSKNYGLRDCATFLLMAKAPWSIVSKSVSPLQVGWPLDKKKTEIKPPDDYLDAVISMMSGAPPGLGREVKTGVPAKYCVWTKMVNDLRRKYETVTMRGYNGQARVTTSAGTVSAVDFVYSLINKHLSYREFVLNLRKHPSLSASFLQNFGEEEWKLASYLQYLLDPISSRRSIFAVQFMEYFGCKFDLWRDDPSDPPPQGVDFDDDDGPHISTVIVTIRAEEQFHRPD